MKRMQRAAILLFLLKELHGRGTWCGETHMQKSTYFLQEPLCVPPGFEFILYKHGPFSFDLSDEITALRGDLLLTIQSRRPYGASLLPSENADTLMARFPITRGRYEKQIRFTAEKLASMGVAELERCATAMFVTREGETDGSLNARANLIHQLKSHITIPQALTALEWTDALNQEAIHLASE